MNVISFLDRPRPGDLWGWGAPFGLRRDRVRAAWEGPARQSLSSLRFWMRDVAGRSDWLDHASDGFACDHRNIHQRGERAHAVAHVGIDIGEYLHLTNTT